jgi:hypothetical protein
VCSRTRLDIGEEESLNNSGNRIRTVELVPRSNTTPSSQMDNDNKSDVRFEVFTAVTMKNGVFWDVTPCGSCKNRRFRGT